MNDWLNITIEILTNIVEAFIYTSFVYCFFEPKYKGIKNLLGFFGCMVIMFATVTFTTFYSLESTFFLVVPDIIVLTLYTVLFLKGKPIVSIIIVTLTTCLNSSICNLVGFLVEFVTGVPVIETMTKSSINRIICIVITKVLFFFLTRIMLKFKKGEIKNLRVKDCVLLITIPFLITYSLVMLLFVFIRMELSTDMLIYMILFSVFNMAAIMFMYYMVYKTDKNNKMKMEYAMLTKQYEMQNESLEQINEVMRQLSAFKHDVKNNMQCVSEMIESGNYNAAASYCEEYCDNIEKVGTVYYTNNNALNAIINVKVNHAIHKNIDVKTAITDSMKYMDDIDICVLLANIMDNAIEAEEKLKKEDRYMELEIYEKKNYHCISLKNRIKDSVLQNNENLLSTKSDGIEHGIGHKNVERIVKKYGGDVNYYEENNMFCCGIIIQKIPIIP